MSSLRPALLIALTALAAPAAATEEGVPSGFAVFGSLGGGGAGAGSRSDATEGGLFEVEVGAGLELASGLRPEVAVVLGLAPRAILGVRPGVRYALEGVPFFFRGAVDFAGPSGSWRLRWLLAGAGAETWVTDQFGLFAETDLGVPVASKAGLAFLLRLGASFRY